MRQRRCVHFVLGAPRIMKIAPVLVELERRNLVGAATGALELALESPTFLSLSHPLALSRLDLVHSARRVCTRAPGVRVRGFVPVVVLAARRLFFIHSLSLRRCVPRENALARV